jgi:hypothetical protein
VLVVVAAVAVVVAVAAGKSLELAEPGTKHLFRARPVRFIPGTVKEPHG